MQVRCVYNKKLTCQAFSRLLSKLDLIIFITSYDVS